MISSRNSSTSSTGWKLRRLLRAAHRASTHKNNLTVLIPEHLAKRLQLVGKRIAKAMDSLRANVRPGQPIPKINFEEVHRSSLCVAVSNKTLKVHNPEFPELSLPTDYQEILNRYATEHQLLLIEGHSLSDTYPAAAAHFTGADDMWQSVTQSVHAERKLAVHMAGFKKNRKRGDQRVESLLLAV